MTLYRLTYLPDSPKQSEVLEAESVDVDSAGTWLVFRRTVFVIGQPRDVVVRRVAAKDVAEVVEV